MEEYLPESVLIEVLELVDHQQGQFDHDHFSLLDGPRGIGSPALAIRRLLQHEGGTRGQRDKRVC